MAQTLFNEQLVKRSKSLGSVLIQVGIGVLALVLILCLALFPQLMTVIPVLLAAIIVVAVVLIRRQNVEFEYILNDRILEVDKILAKSSRSNIAYIDLSAVEAFDREERDKRELSAVYQTVYDCTGDEDEVYGIVYLGVGEEGKCILLFNPNEKMLAGLQRAISPRIWKYNA